MSNRLPRVDAVVALYPTTIAVAGGVVLAGSVALMPPPISRWPVMLAMIIFVTVLRRYVVPLSKFSYLSFTSFVGLTASHLFGPVAVMVALTGGTMAGDWGWLRKSWRAAASEGFVYLVARLGVTGRSAETGAPGHRGTELRSRIAAVRAVTDLPVAVGFGISGPADAAEVAAIADGVVVGSALVERMRSGGAAAGLAWLGTLRTAMDAARRAA